MLTKRQAIFFIFLVFNELSFSHMYNNIHEAILMIEPTKITNNNAKAIIYSFISLFTNFI